METNYWIRVGILEFQGYTREQGREKINQDLVDKGKLKQAQFVRELQDKIHTLDKKDQPLHHRHLNPHRQRKMLPKEQFYHHKVDPWGFSPVF